MKKFWKEFAKRLIASKGEFYSAFETFGIILVINFLFGEYGFWLGILSTALFLSYISRFWCYAQYKAANKARDEAFSRKVEAMKTLRKTKARYE